LRQPGQPFTANAGYVGTLDNGATVTELRFLARVISANPPEPALAYRRSFVRGVRYLLEAQYPNGGWPQVWPLAGGYHDAITFNDGAMLAAIRLMGDVAAGEGDYAFAPADLRRAAAEAWKHGLQCLLETRVVLADRPSIWPQQSDALTLQPAGARNFEPRALASSESAEILLYLMDLPDPSPSAVRAVRGGVAWLEKAALRDKAWTAADPSVGRRLVDRPGAPPLWSRFYDIETGRPIFGDRDQTIHDDVHDLVPERRNGYAWFGTAPAKVLARYPEWARVHASGSK
jgi:PelA/Pel-15E family pectate lyase